MKRIHRSFPRSQACLTLACSSAHHDRRRALISELRRPSASISVQPACAFLHRPPHELRHAHASAAGHSVGSAGPPCELRGDPRALPLPLEKRRPASMAVQDDDTTGEGNLSGTLLRRRAMTTTPLWSLLHRGVALPPPARSTASVRH